TLYGANGSPYSRKMRALMRYRRLEFDWVLRTPAVREAQAARLKVQLVPVLELPEDGSLHLDSTEQIALLEARHAERSVVPPDPAMAFLADLIEDFADEWLTKAMFWYRWAAEPDRTYASEWIIADSRPDLAGEAFATAQQAIRDRQVGRMALVGCTPANAPVIEASLRRVLALLDPHVAMARHLFGSRPSLADFALFGQLIVLDTDPTPAALTRAAAPRVEHWLRILDDASGLPEGAWSAEPGEVVHGLLALSGDTYAPFLLANAAALAAGAPELALDILGRRYVQAPFGYQAKCLARLRARHAALPAAAAARLRPLLGEHGWLQALTETGS
ncbi:MAG: glutathione S-transferase family protein, partial [Acetobacteraceae bacterium]|nr:glutathione S-transferase family protein [Acetobacteraceae bacterium]